jgi:hypothetical protein
MLELYYKYPRVLQRLRSGALGKQMDDIAAQLAKLGYKRSSAKIYLSEIARFSSFASKRCDARKRIGYVVGWMLAARESAELAEQLIAETVEKQNIVPGTLTLHADRGTSMRSKPVAALLIDLDIAKTHSRPHVSDDNEAQFKTLKYRPDFPQRPLSVL